MATDDPLVLAYAEAARESFSKFTFYFTGLAFTLLGLSVQTAALGTNVYGNLAELVGWLLLLISGLAGLGQLRRLPAVHYMAAEKEQIRATLERLQEIEIGGGTIVAAPDPLNFEPGSEVRSIPQSVQRLRTLKEIQFKAASKELEKRRSLGNTWRAQSWSFVAGMIAIMVSRAWDPIAALLDLQ